MEKRSVVVGAVLVVPLAMVLLFIGIASPGNRPPDVSISAYVNSVLPVILGAQSTEELLKRSAPDPPMGRLSERLMSLNIQRLRKFGPLVSYDGVAVHLHPAQAKNGIDGGASCTAIAKFRNGTARIGLELVRQGGEWKISGFFVTDDAKFRLREREMIRSDVFSPVFPLAILLPLGPGLALALMLVQKWRDVVAWRAPECFLALVPTTAWNVLELPGVSWHPGKGWGNILVELPALGLLAVVYVVARRHYLSRGHADVGLCLRLPFFVRGGLCIA